MGKGSGFVLRNIPLFCSKHKMPPPDFYLFLKTQNKQQLMLLLLFTLSFFWAGGRVLPSKERLDSQLLLSPCTLPQRPIATVTRKKRSQLGYLGASKGLEVPIWRVKNR